MLIIDQTTLPFDYTRCSREPADCPHGGVCRRREPGRPTYQFYGDLLLRYNQNGACENRVVTTQQRDEEYRKAALHG